MFFRIRTALGLALLLALFTSITVFAKGEFSFITITGPGIDEEIRATESELTADFFAFADFYRDKVEAPADPGEGYEITRYYVDGKREIAFDQLHYYPEAGFVYYDGILNGDSEYDGEWYSANPAIKNEFEAALSAASIAKVQPARPAEQEQPGPSIDQPQPVASSRFIVSMIAAAGLGVLLWFALRLRKPSSL